MAMPVDSCSFDNAPLPDNAHVVWNSTFNHTMIVYLECNHGYVAKSPTEGVLFCNRSTGIWDTHKEGNCTEIPIEPTTKPVIVTTLGTSSTSMESTSHRMEVTTTLVIPSTEYTFTPQPTKQSTMTSLKSTTTLTTSSTTKSTASTAVTEKSTTTITTNAPTSTSLNSSSTSSIPTLQPPQPSSPSRPSVVFPSSTTPLPSYTQEVTGIAAKKSVDEAPSSDPSLAVALGLVGVAMIIIILIILLLAFKKKNRKVGHSPYYRYERKSSYDSSVEEFDPAVMETLSAQRLASHHSMAGGPFFNSIHGYRPKILANNRKGIKPQGTDDRFITFIHVGQNGDHTKDFGAGPHKRRPKLDKLVFSRQNVYVQDPTMVSATVAPPASVVSESPYESLYPESVDSYTLPAQEEYIEHSPAAILSTDISKLLPHTIRKKHRRDPEITFM